MVSGFGMSAIVPLRRSAIQRPLPSTGSRRVGSPASTVVRGAPTPCRPSRRTSLPSLGGTALALVGSLLSATERCHRRPGDLINQLTLILVHARRRQGLAGSWGTPLCACRALRPRRDLRARPSRRIGAAFRNLNNVGSRNKLAFEAQSHGLFTRCLRFAARVTPWRHKTRFRLLARLCRAGLDTRRVPPQSFRVLYISSPLPRLDLSHLNRKLSG
jgi:hypothetical protein